MANPDKTIRRIEEWQISHVLPYQEGLSEDTCYSLMKMLGQNVSVSPKYFHYRASHAASKASAAVDSTTISSYSEHLNDVGFGYHKESNGLASVKLLTLFHLNDRQPIAFSRQPGNIPDVISVLNALEQLSVLGMNKPLLVLDGGFFSEDNILTFIHTHIKFLMRGQLDSRWIFPELKTIASSVKKPSNACPGYPDIYCVTKRIIHAFSIERQRTRADIQKGGTVTEERRLYLHFILDTEKARLDTVILMGDIQKAKVQLQNGVDISLLTKAEGRIAERFLIIKKVRGHLSVAMNDKALLNWLNSMSAANLFDWFDATQETTVNTNIGRARWRTENTERDRLFLSKLG